MINLLKYLLLTILLIVIGGYIYYLTLDQNQLQKHKQTLFEWTHDREKVQENEAFQIGYQAWLYGLVRVKGMLLEQKATHPKYRDYAPINEFHISKELAQPGFTDFTPNHDTYYGLAWLDVSKGPIMMDIPEIPERYFTIQATDAGLNTFNYIGSRVNSKAGKFAYTKFDWEGELPDSVIRIDSPTNQVFLQARTVAFKSEAGDDEKMFVLMSKYDLYPLDSTATYEAISAESPIPNPLNSNPDYMSLNYFKLLNQALKKNPPSVEERGLVAQFAKLGIGENETFEESKLTETQKKGLADGMMAALRRVYDELRFSGERLGGFNFKYNLGDYKHNYVLGSAVAFFGYGANTTEEALYPTTLIDKNGDFLNGKNRYQIHFEKDQIPPVHAFWSITMYSRPENQLIENEINRYNIGGLTPDLKYNEDGSLDIFVQNEKPENISNWLPAPEGDFWLILRMYHPKEEVLNRKYEAPFVMKI